MNENELNVVKEHNFCYPLTNDIEFIIDSCVKDYHNNYLHISKHECI